MDTVETAFVGGGSLAAAWFAQASLMTCRATDTIRFLIRRGSFPSLKKEHSLFWCDVFRGMVQQGIGTDKHSFEFIMEFHDIWSRVIVQDNDIERANGRRKRRLRYDGRQWRRQ